MTSGKRMYWICGLVALIAMAGVGVTAACATVESGGPPG